LYTQLKQHIDATIGSGNLRDAVRDDACCVCDRHGLMHCVAPSTQQVQLPPGEDLNEWCGSCMRCAAVLQRASVTAAPRLRLAVNTVDFFNAISMLYGTLTECCTATSCPTMCAGPKYEYRWADGVKVRVTHPCCQRWRASLSRAALRAAQVKKPIECTAPEYVLYLMEWIESQMDDEAVRRGVRTHAL
jgi:MOB kinase activator 1